MYFLHSLQQQKKKLEKKIEREKIVINMLPELSVQILEIVQEHGKITISQIVKITGANRNTVKKHLWSLVSAYHIAQHGTGKGTWYGRI